MASNHRGRLLTGWPFAFVWGLQQLKYAIGVPDANMVFIESTRFAGRRQRYLDAEAFRDLQNLILTQPEKGKLIRGGRGLRKIRFAPAGQGKSGGYRVIYYLAVSEHTVYLLDLYAKSDKADLTPDEIRALAALIKP